jgi:hypothetical protein
MEKELTKTLTDQSLTLARTWLTELFEKKLADAGINDKPTLIEALVAHAFAGGGENFQWKEEDEGQPDEHHQLDIAITPEDLAELDRIQKEFQAKFPAIIDEIATGIATKGFKDFKSQWPVERTYAYAERQGFLERLDQRWGAAFGLLRMLEHGSRELLGEAYSRHRRSRSKTRLNRDVLIRLHTRACQVTAEIITLMENGYADGAMARWRTLHEITVVAFVIADFGEDIAERYLLHETVESKKVAQAYMDHLGPGDEPLDAAELAQIQSDYDQVITRYGKGFRTQYGWAAHHLKIAEPNFAQLEEAAGRAALRSRYKLASYNVHAGTKGITFKLGTLDQSGFIGGASDTGLDEPGIDAAYTLTQINMVLLGPRWNLSDQIAMRISVLIRDAACREFSKAHRSLRRDNAKIVRQQRLRTKSRASKR